MTNLIANERENLGLEKALSAHQQALQSSGQQTRSNGTGGKQSRKSSKLPSGKAAGPEQHSLVYMQCRDSRSHADQTGSDAISKALSSQKKRPH